MADREPDATDRPGLGGPSERNDGDGDGMAAAIARLPLAMVLTDPRIDDNPIVYVNDAFQKVTLYSREFAIGRNCRFLQGEDTDPDDVAQIREGIEAKEDVTLDLLNYKADGTPFTNRLLISPIRNDQDEVTAFLGVQRELPASKEMVAKNRDARAADVPDEPGQDLMLAEVQHRVKNHLAMIVSLIRMQASREVTQASFEALAHRVQALALLYDELSAVGTAKASDETVPTGAYLSRVCSALAAIEGRGSIRVNIECEEVELPVDQTARLGLILTEIMTNALEHAFEGRDEGVIRVRFQQLTRGGVRLMVEDDGIGMPDGSSWPQGAKSVERQKAITTAADEDEELDTTGNPRRSGMGGSIVKALIASLGATLDVNSTGSGTIVTVDLPSDERD